MFRCFGTIAAAFACLALVPATSLAATIELKGVGLYSKKCGETAVEVLKKIDGVADPSADVEAKKISFTVKDYKALIAAYKALLAAGFYGAPSIDGEIEKNVTDKEAQFIVGKLQGFGKANELKVTGVHCCCAECQKAITELFREAKVQFIGDGPKKNLKITGKNLDRIKSINKLYDAGFFGKLEDTPMKK